MYPNKTEVVYSTWTPRASKMKDVNEVVVFGLQAFIKDRLQGLFDRNFFQKKKEEVVSDYARIISGTLGVKNPDTKHIEDLHDLGYLPLCIRALPEGSVAPLRTPMITIHNTDPRFFWLTNYIETLMSCELWQPSTSATIAREYRKRFNEWAIITGSPTDFIKFQGHDFSMRGMSSLMSAINSGMGHLLSFYGTDTIPAIQGAEYLYGADVTKEVIGLSVPATEHSIQCTYGDDTQYIKDMITKVHPSGIVSVVSDGYDFWKVMTEILPSLKEEIMSRDGKLVIRPDSGDPVKIVCGDPEGKTEAERKGAVQILWETFGGTRNAKGYATLNEHIGLIYGDAITLRRAEDILQSLAEKGFAANNVVFGIGSYTYQYNTRDTFGFALKSTLAVIDGKEVQIFKDPKTDDGVKKSQKGRVIVLKDGDSLKSIDGFSLSDVVSGDQLREVYRDGQLKVEQTFSEIRERLWNNAF
jgi:nicotinamide phosphoribosyltransferase